MFPIKYVSIALVVASMLPSLALADNPTYFSGDRVVEVERTDEYTATMHNNFSFASKYEEGGVYYYSSGTDSFGNLQVLDTTTEMVFCGSGDKDFMDTVNSVASSSVGSEYESGSSGINTDATQAGFSADEMEDGIRSTLLNNANSQAKGRFCYDESDSAGRIDYRTSGAESAIYCSPDDFSAATFTDETSGKTCSIELDVAIKVGSRRIVRQLQSASSTTIGEGYLGCYANAATGEPVLQLHANSSDCSGSSSAECSLTCDWAENLVCNPVDLPSWGYCEGQGTLVFANDVISVSSIPGLSYDTETGKQYTGSATFTCRSTDSGTYWSLGESSCTEM